jgi:hypothetical protein
MQDPLLISHLKKWHEENNHAGIAQAIGKIPREEWDYELSSLYARALNNLERYEEALDVLLPLEEAGKEDGLWYFRIGYSLYYLNCEEEAARYFQKAMDYGENDEDTRQLLEASLEEAEERRRKEEHKTTEAPEIYTEKEMDTVSAHIAQHFGGFKNVLHELASPDIHVDIAVVEPAKGRNYYVLCTLGMGAHRMNVPPECEGLERAELLICLPPDWKLDKTDEETWYWPLSWLKILARLPLEEDTWLGWGHTIPNGEPFADNTGFTTMLLLNPGTFNEEAGECTLPGGETVNFYQLIPLYEEEAQYKVEHSTDKLLSKIDEEALEYVRLNRRSFIVN